MLLWPATEHISKHPQQHRQGQLIKITPVTPSASRSRSGLARTLQRELLLWLKLTRLWSFRTFLEVLPWLSATSPLPKDEKRDFFSPYLPPSGILPPPPVCVPIHSHFYLSLEPCGENPVCFSYRLKPGYFVFNCSNDEAATKENKRRCNYRMKQLSIFLYLAPLVVLVVPSFFLSAPTPQMWIICVWNQVCVVVFLWRWAFLRHY